MKYRITMDVVVATELDALKFMNAIEYLKPLIIKERNLGNIPSSLSCECVIYENDGSTKPYIKTDITGARKIHDSSQA